jgi:hypothetical protein
MRFIDVINCQGLKVDLILVATQCATEVEAPSAACAWLTLGGMAALRGW